MLSDQEREELKALARSAEIREEFRQLKRLSKPGGTVNVGEFLRWLTAMHRILPPYHPHPFVKYTNVRI